MAILFFWAMHTFMREQGWLWLQKNVRDKHIFLTGAGSGLGRLMALKFAKMGAKLSLVDLNFKGLEETK